MTPYTAVQLSDLVQMKNDARRLILLSGFGSQTHWLWDMGNFSLCKARQVQSCAWGWQSPCEPGCAPWLWLQRGSLGRDCPCTQRGLNAFLPWIQALQLGVLVGISNGRVTVGREGSGRNCPNHQWLWSPYV